MTKLSRLRGDFVAAAPLARLPPRKELAERSAAAGAGALASKQLQHNCIAGEWKKDNYTKCVFCVIAAGRRREQKPKRPAAIAQKTPFCSFGGVVRRRPNKQQPPLAVAHPPPKL